MELMKYKDWEEKSLPRFLELFGYADESLNLALKVMEPGRNIRGTLSDHERHCYASSAGKQIRMFVAACELCKKGLAHESLLIMRAMFELTVNLKILQLTRQPAVFAERWRLWCGIEAGMEPHLVEMHPDWIAVYERTRTAFSRRKWRDFKWHGPTLRSIRRRCRIVDHVEKVTVSIEIYKQLYGPASGVSHGSDLHAHAWRDEGSGNLMVNLIPSHKLLPEMVVAAMVLLRLSMSIAGDGLGFEVKNEVETLGKLCEKATAFNRVFEAEQQGDQQLKAE